MAEARDLSARGPRPRRSRSAATRRCDDVELRARRPRRASWCWAPTARARACCCARCTACIAPTRGHDPLGAAAARARATQAMVFQRPVMLRRSALANIEYALAVNGVDGPGARRRARAKRSSTWASRTSPAAPGARALRRRAAAHRARARLGARARACSSSTSPPRASIRPRPREVERIDRARSTPPAPPIVMTTHNLGLARRVADEILFLHEGRLTEQTPADRFFTAPRSPEAARFLKGELPWNIASPASSPA